MSEPTPLKPLEVMWDEERAKHVAECLTELADRTRVVKDVRCMMLIMVLDNRETIVRWSGADAMERVGMLEAMKFSLLASKEGLQ